MPDVINEYQKWKQQGENLRTQAKQAMESRFRELLTEAVAIAEEYRADFGAPLKPPAGITSFRYKPSGRPKAKKAAKAPGGKTPVTAPPEPKAPAKPDPKAPAKPDPKAPAKPDPKVVALQKRLASAKKKLEDAKASGSATRALEDRVYEIEDALRLAESPA
jgi:hypothetical protein